MSVLVFIAAALLIVVLLVTLALLVVYGVERAGADLFPRTRFDELEQSPGAHSPELDDVIARPSSHVTIDADRADEL